MYYKKLDYDPTQDFSKQLKGLIKALPTHLHSELNSAIPENPELGNFYMLPKIHKPGNPGRPIITGMNTLTEQISGVVENILKPLVKNTASYLQDTTDFLNKLHNIQLPSESILVTMDVESLYSNIPHKDGISACHRFLSSSPNHRYRAEDVTRLIDFILTHNYFTFHNDIYLQCMGTAMGSKMAPQYANLFMADLEDKFLSKIQLKPHIYHRYIDDIFMIWTEGEENLKEFHSFFNLFHPSIKLKMDYSRTQVNFLDTTVSIKDDKLHTSIYRKPTDRCSYLHSSSFHPQHTKRAIIHSQATRYHRICSDPQDRDRHLRDLSQSFHKKGYSKKTIHTRINTALQTPRDKLLQYKEKKANTRVPLVTTYNPALEGIRRIIKELQPIITEDETLKEVFQQPPILAFRQPPNLRHKLISRKLHSDNTDTNKGTKPCNNKRCKLCSHINVSKSVPHTKGTFNITGSYSCTSSNVVYLIQCNKCKHGCYIGETGQKLQKRVNLHRHTIKEHKENDFCTPVGHHFSQTDHSMEDLNILVLKGNFKNTHDRKTFELRMIIQFDTKNNGLNVDLSFLNHYSKVL